VFIRYFARTDDSELGRAAAAYCDALVDTGTPVRLVSTHVAELQVDSRGRSSSGWDRHRALLTTSMDGGFVNVVCGDLVDWGRFHTPSVTNALLLAGANFEPRAPQTDLLEVVALYDVIYAPSAELASIVERATGLRPIVVPVGRPEAGGAFLRLQVF